MTTASDDSLCVPSSATVVKIVLIFCGGGVNIFTYQNNFVKILAISLSSFLHYHHHPPTSQYQLL